METLTLPTHENTRIAVIGLGYVGLPLAVEFSKRFPTLGFDINELRVDELRSCHDGTGEVSEEELKQAGLELTCNLADLEECNVYLVTVPTPVNRHKYPDLTPLENASRMVGQVLRPGDCVIYESTVYPGATEEICVPLLESTSGLTFNRHFTCGYSPERINPGDKLNRLTSIVKVTSGSTPEAAEFVDRLYGTIIAAGTHKAPTMRVAEAAKAIENTQRDINIAFMNELAIIFSKLGIDTEEVLKAAGTKWNFLPFRPGLVGGHCIGVDPYYLIHKATEAGHTPDLISFARRINDGMSRHVTDEVMRLMAEREICIVGARILVMGLAFKENCPDLRNTRVVDIVKELKRLHAKVDVFDPQVDWMEAEAEYGIRPIEEPEHGAYDAVILAVAHREFTAMTAEQIRAYGKPGAVLFDVKYILPAAAVDGRL